MSDSEPKYSTREVVVMKPPKNHKITDIYRPVLPKRSGVLSIRQDNKHLGGGVK
jgi:hypothetical protein